MKKIVSALLFGFILTTPVFTQNSGLVLYADSLYQEAPATDFEIDVLNYMVNLSGQYVSVQWTRSVEQPFPAGWTYNFCDDSLCYTQQVGSSFFNLAPGDTGILKPVFYPHDNTGTAIFHLALESLTPAVPFTANVVYVAVGTQNTGTGSISALQNSAAVFPNPADESLHVVFSDPDFRGTLQITDALGRVVLMQNHAKTEEILDVSGLPAGLYGIQAWTENGRLSLSKGWSKQ